MLIEHYITAIDKMILRRIGLDTTLRIDYYFSDLFSTFSTFSKFSFNYLITSDNLSCFLLTVAMNIRLSIHLVKSFLFKYRKDGVSINKKKDIIVSVRRGISMKIIMKLYHSLNQ